MEERHLREDWLAGNAVTAFVAALLLGQVWQAPEGTTKLLFVFTVPDPSSYLILIVMAVLFVSSLFFAIASIVAKFQNTASKLVNVLSVMLSKMGLLAFIIGFASALPGIAEHWWSIFLVIGGFLFMLFLLYRFFRGLCLLNKSQWRKPAPENTVKE